MSRRFVATLLLAGALAVLPGCLAGPTQRSVPTSRLAGAEGWRMTSLRTVPRVRGVEGCGSQALATVLAPPDADPEAVRRLAAELPWHEAGATPVDLLLEARRRGATARVHRGDVAMLRQLVAQDRPPLVMLDAGLALHLPRSRVDLPEVMHWAVVTGLQEPDGGGGEAGAPPRAVALGAIGGAHHVVAWEDFVRRWERSDACLLEVTSAPPDA